MFPDLQQVSTDIPKTHPTAPLDIEVDGRQVAIDIVII